MNHVYMGFLCTMGMYPDVTLCETFVTT
jgi:hypothetical protein